MGQSKRKLTKKELIRKKRFEELRSEMEQNGYREQSLTVSVLMANLVALVIMLPFMALIGWLYFAVNKHTGAFASEWGALLLLVYLCLIVVHELIHGITWGIFAPDHFRSIEFGVIWKALTPYCTCSKPLKKWQYILGTAMPTIVLGFGIAAVAIVFHSLFLLCLSEIMLWSGGGDFLIILKILMYRTKSKDIVYCDHPYEPGVVLFEKNHRCFNWNVFGILVQSKFSKRRM